MEMAVLKLQTKPNELRKQVEIVPYLSVSFTVSCAIFLVDILFVNYNVHSKLETISIGQNDLKAEE